MEQAREKIENKEFKSKAKVLEDLCCMDDVRDKNGRLVRVVHFLDSMDAVLFDSIPKMVKRQLARVNND